MSSLGEAVRFGRELREICGSEHVIDDQETLGSAPILGVTPSLAVRPSSPEEVAAVLRFANEHGLIVVPAGGFTQQQAGNPPAQVDVLLSTSRLTTVEHYDAGDLTIGVGAGCTVAQLSAKVAADGLLFAGDPPHSERATIGGLLATGTTGPLRHGYGGLRDYCIGIKFVTGDGRLAKGGGRVVKNVAGYDLMKLLIGSQGTLAVITGASFKLFPAPRQTRTFVAEFATSAEAIDFRSHVLRSPLDPVCLELISPEAAALVGAKAQSWSVWVRVAGSDTVLARYRQELGTQISQEVGGAEEQDLWQAVSDFSHELRARNPHSLLIALSLPLAEVKSVLSDVTAVAQSNDLHFAAIGRVGVGHLLVGLWPQTDSSADFVRAVSELRNRLSRDASLSVVHGAREAQLDAAAWGRTPTHLDSMRAVKRALDPQDILNRGRFLF